MKETKRMFHTKETLDVFYFDHERAEYPNVPSYLFFDEASYSTGGPIQREGLGHGASGYANVHKIFFFTRKAPIIRKHGSLVVSRESKEHRRNLSKDKKYHRRGWQAF